MFIGGDIVSGWKILAIQPFNSEREIGEYFRCQELWRQSEEEGLLVKNLFCQEINLPSNIAHMYPFKLLVVVCGAHSEWKERIESMLFTPSPFRTSEFPIWVW